MMPNGMNIKLEAVVPKQDVVDVKKLLGVIRGAQLEVARGMRTDLQKTTRTWKTKVIFVIKVTGVSEAVIEVYTDNQIYAYVTYGTKPHIIRPRRGKVLAFGKPFRAKTSVRWLGSRNGVKGTQTVYAREVHHPGTEARMFHEVIADKWQPVFTALLQRRIDNAVFARS